MEKYLLRTFISIIIIQLYYSIISIILVLFFIFCEIHWKPDVLE